MAYNYKAVIRKHSWWKTANSPVRTFTIAELWYDHDERGDVEFHRVGLLEYGYDNIEYIEYGDFIKRLDDGKIIPINVIPVFR